MPIAQPCVASSTRPVGGTLSIQGHSRNASTYGQSTSSGKRNPSTDDNTGAMAEHGEVGCERRIAWQPARRPDRYLLFNRLFPSLGQINSKRNYPFDKPHYN